MGDDAQPLAQSGGRVAKVLFELLLAAGVAAVLVIAALRPSVEDLRGRLAPDLGDPLFNLVVLKWVDHSVHQGFTDFASPGFFYPSRASLLRSDHLLGPGLVFSALRTAGLGAIASYNALWLGSFVLGFVGTFWVGRRIGLGLAAALVSGAVVTLAPIRLEGLSHLQMLWSPWLAPLLWSWHRFWSVPAGRTALPAIALYALHLTGGLYLAYMVHLPLAILTIAAIASRARRRPTPRELSWVLVTLACAALTAAATFLPYRRVEGLWIQRTSAEIESYGATLFSFLQASDHNFYAPWLVALRRVENSLFPGLLATALLLPVFWALIRRAARRLSGRARWLAAPAVVACVSGLLLGDAWFWASARHVESGSDWLPVSSYSPAFWLLLSGIATLLALALPGVDLLPAGDPEVARFGRALLVCTVACALACLPAVFLTLAKWLPGLSGMRVPPRFYFLALPGLGWLAGATYDRIRARAASRASQALLLGAMLGLLAGDARLAPLTWRPVAEETEFPPVYHWIAGEDRIRSYVEVPLAPLRRLHEATIPMYHATLHHKPIVNGYSGTFPSGYHERTASLRPLPGADGLRWLRELGVSAIVIHRQNAIRLLGRRGYRKANASLAAGGLRRAYHDERYDVFLVGDPVPRARAPG